MKLLAAERIATGELVVESNDDPYELSGGRSTSTTPSSSSIERLRENCSVPDTTAMSFGDDTSSVSLLTPGGCVTVNELEVVLLLLWPEG
jgi:hypothetical protein